MAAEALTASEEALGEQAPCSVRLRTTKELIAV